MEEPNAIEQHSLYHFERSPAWATLFLLRLVRWIKTDDRKDVIPRHRYPAESTRGEHLCIVPSRAYVQHGSQLLL
jgi:hypothetical protein